MALSLEQHRCKYYKGTTTIKDILTERIEKERKQTTLGISIKNVDRIPENLIIEILSRLPVKALLQFKSVCKLWYDIIKSSYFISKNLKNYYDNNKNWRDCLIVQYSVTQAGELSVYELLLDDTENRALSYKEIYTPVHNTYLCGPCNGIYYLWSFSGFVPERSLWNPTLNEFKPLPAITCWKPKLPRNSASLAEWYGFGYDSKTDDYKVILILGYKNKRSKKSEYADNPMSIVIYSLRTNSWRYWGDMDKSYAFDWMKKNYVFVKGCYYWLASRYVNDRGCEYEMIFSFDISDETCQVIPLPQFKSKPHNGSQMIVYQDSIGFVYVPNNDRTNFCIWTWNDGVWTQKLSMKLDFEAWGAFSEWRDNTLVFRKARSKLVLLDTDTKEIFELDDPRAGGCENICAYKESLVSINDFGKDTTHKGRKG